MSRLRWAGLILPGLLFLSLAQAAPDDPKPVPPTPEGKKPGKKPAKQKPAKKPGKRKPGAKAPGKKPAKKKPAAEKKPAKKKEHKRKVRAGRPTLITNARIPGARGTGVVVLNGGKIAQLARAIRRVPKGFQVIDAKGGRVLPGRIDAWASLGNPDPRGRVLDAFDPYDEDAVREALAGGVTTVFLNPMRNSASSGEGAIVKMLPGASREEFLVREGVALHSALGFSGVGGGAVRDYDALRAQLTAAQRYQEVWVDYEEALEKYEKELKAYAAKVKPKGKAGAKKSPKGKAPAKKAPSPRRPTPKRPTPKRPTPKSGPSKSSKSAEPKAPKQPKRPKTDRALERLVAVLDRELPLRVEAHRVEDIVNLLELQQEFEFELILEGATEGHRLAEVLAKREIPVVLASQLVSGIETDAFPFRRAPDLAARLEAAGVEVVIGSDGWQRSGALGTIAALHAQAGLSRRAAEAAVTSRAAELLGLEKHGKIAPGYVADIVIMSPASLGADRVETVLIDGRVVFERSAP